MLRRLLITTIVFSVLSSCTHAPVKKNRESLKQHALQTVLHDPLYNNVKNEIIKADATHLKECNCMVAFYRDLFREPDNTARYALDKAVGDEALKVSGKNDTVSILAFGSGLLLNELTAFANVIAHKKNLKIYITDWAYAFYGDEDFPKKAIDMAKDPTLIPPGYKSYYVWNWDRRKNKKWPYLPVFETHHAAIDEFKKVIAGLDAIYGTTSTVEIIKPATDKPRILPPVDMIIAIDAFTDLPNLIYHLHYQLKLSKNPIRFVALNKYQPLGNFWEPEGGRELTEIDKKPLSLDVYEVWSAADNGKYRLIRHAEFAPSPYQEEKTRESRSKQQRDITVSPFDLLE